MKEVITSPNNPKIKYIKSLHLKKYRDKHGLYIVEGIKMVEEALAMDNYVESIICAEGFDIKDLGLRSGLGTTPILWVTKNIFRDISGVETPQGIMAILRQDYKGVGMVFEGTRGFWVVLDGIQDPGNLGTIIRTLDAAGGSGVILLEGCADPYNPKVVRATMGSILRVPIIKAPDTEELLTSIKTGGGRVLAGTMGGEDIFRWESKSPKGPIALVIGNESRGISPRVMGLATDIVSIPIVGGAESLNASVAAGIMIYEIIKKV